MATLFGYAKLGIIRVTLALGLVSLLSLQYGILTIAISGAVNSLVLGVGTLAGLNELLACVLLVSLTAIVCISSVNQELSWIYSLLSTCITSIVVTIGVNAFILAVLILANVVAVSVLYSAS